MISLDKLRQQPLKIDSNNLFFSRMDRLHRKKLDFDVYLPFYGCNLQRELCWMIEQKRELILSIFMERYIPPVAVIGKIDFDDERNDIHQVIDGKQRLSTMIQFLNNEFTIIFDGIEYYFKDLPDDFQRCYNQYNINCAIAYDQYEQIITDQQKVAWFKKINFFGTPVELSHLEKFKK